jgi:hypothetical protein
MYRAVTDYSDEWQLIQKFKKPGLLYNKYLTERKNGLRTTLTTDLERITCTSILLGRCKFSDSEGIDQACQIYSPIWVQVVS